MANKSHHFVLETQVFCVLVLVFLKERNLICQFEVDLFLGLGKKGLNTNVILGTIRMPGLYKGHLSSAG